MGKILDEHWKPFRVVVEGKGAPSNQPSQPHVRKVQKQALQCQLPGLQGEDFVSNAGFQASRAKISRAMSASRPPGQGFHGQSWFPSSQGKDFAAMPSQAMPVSRPPGQRFRGQCQASTARISRAKLVSKPSGPRFRSDAGFQLPGERFHEQRRFPGLQIKISRPTPASGPSGQTLPGQCWIAVSGCKLGV